MNYFAEVVLDRLVHVQEMYPELINPGINVYEEFGLARSFRRGSNLQAQNCQVPPDVINWINR